MSTPELGSIYLNPQPASLTVSDNLHTTCVIDREGRLISCFLGGRNYRFGLSGSVLMKAAAPQAPRLRQLLAADEGARLRADVRARLAMIAAGLAPQLPAELQDWLGLALAWDEQRLSADRRLFEAAYRPVSIVPPDQYRALVLQMTEGCSWNRCSFCSFYRDRSFRIKSPEALRRHIRQVKALLGRGIALRRAVFLGDANALIVPQPRLLELLAVTRAELAVGGPARPQELYAFLDIFGAEQKTAEQYAELRAAGVRRLYIGLESGDEDVFRLLNKPGSPAQCVEAVRCIRSAGIQVGVILLAGAGGAALAEQHVAHSLVALAAMGLGAGDLVYVSPLAVPADGEYAARERELGSAPLAPEALSEQLGQLKEGARTATGGGPQVALYHIEEWLY